MTGGPCSRLAVACLIVGTIATAALGDVRPAVASGPAGPAMPAPGQVALTFDDGPSPYTAAILDILAEYDVPATFFVLGAAVDGQLYGSLVERMHHEGHSVQNHSYRHPFLTRLSDWNIQNEFRSGNDAIERRIGVRPTCYRPPYGATNTRVRANALGMTEIMWDVDTRDFRRPGVGVLISRALSGADGRPRNVLMHDGGGPRAQTVAALRPIIEGYLARGYEFVALCAPQRRAPVQAVDRAPVSVEPIGPSAGLHVIDPVRVFDSRVGDEPVEAGTVTRLDIGDVIPDGSSAVVAQITAVDPESPGFVSPFRCIDGNPTTSALNISSGALAASAIIGVDNGEICVVTSMRSHLLIDLTATLGPEGELGFRPVRPDRVFDSRINGRPPGEPMASGTTSRVELPGQRAAFVNVTAAQIADAGFVTAWPCALQRPDTSVLNFHPASSAVANSVIVPLDDDGALCFYNVGATELIVDVFGTFAAPPPSPTANDETAYDDSLLWFRPAKSTRVLDTRHGTGGWEGFLHPDADLRLRTTLAPGSVGIGTLTATRSDRPGYLTLWSGTGDPPPTSNLNYDRLDIANLAAIEVGEDGRVVIEAGGLGSAQVLLDLQGWFEPR